MTHHADHLFVKMPNTMRIFDEDQVPAPDLFGRALRAFPWLDHLASPAPEPEAVPDLPNAEKYPTLAATGFVFAEAIDLGPVTRPACACPTCGRLTERVEAVT